MIYSVKYFALHLVFGNIRGKIIMKIGMVYLYDLYSPLLSERQREILNLLYNEDESLAEISENIGITRQGVRDYIVKSEALLVGFENALHLHEKIVYFGKRVDELIKLADEKGADPELKEKISELKEFRFQR